MSETPQGDESQRRQQDREPNFTLPRHGVIREDNWAEYEAQGFRPVPEDEKSAGNYYGVANVYTGDAYDWDAERPLRHKPGVGVYTNAAGLEHSQASVAKWDELHMQLRAREVRRRQSEGSPGNS
jgi:hypothetical protein